VHQVAVKSFTTRAKGGRQPADLDGIRSEIAALKVLQPSGHAHIANILEVHENDHDLHAILEYCGGGSVQKYLAGQARRRRSNRPETVPHAARPLAAAAIFRRLSDGRRIGRWGAGARRGSGREGGCDALCAGVKPGGAPHARTLAPHARARSHARTLARSRMRVRAVHACAERGRTHARTRARTRRSMRVRVRVRVLTTTPRGGGGEQPSAPCAVRQPGDER